MLYENPNFTFFYFYVIHGRLGSTAIRMPVCLSAQLPKKLHVQTTQNFLYMLPVAVARYSADDNAIRYVLPASWMTSRFHITKHMLCTARLVAEGCQSAEGNAEGRSFSAETPPVPALPLAD